MGKLLISYQPHDPLAKAFQLQLQRRSADNWDYPAVEFHEQLTDLPVTGRKQREQKRQAQRLIKQARQILIVISRDTWQSEWVDWEIATAIRYDKQLLAAKLDAANIVPLALIGADPQWIDPFDPLALSQRHI